MKLAPMPSELLGMVLDANRHSTLLLPTGTRETATNAQNSTPRGNTQTSPMTPHNRPPAHNLAHGIYYIRSSSRHRLHEDGYPNPTLDKDLALPTRALCLAVLGFPTYLLVTLGISLASPHEQVVIRTNPAAFSLENGCEGLGARNCLAVVNLLLQRLQMELERLDAAETGFPSRNDAEDRLHLHDDGVRRRQIRRQCVQIYRTGQRKILQENIAALESGLMASFVRMSTIHELHNPSAGMTEYGTLLTLSIAFEVLRLLQPEKHDSVLLGLAATYGLSYTPTQPRTLLSQFREMGVEEVVWAVWIGTVVKMWTQFDDMQRVYAEYGEDPETAIRNRLWRWCGWLEVAYELRVGEDAGGRVEASDRGKADEDGFIQHLHEVVQNMQANPGSLDESPWSPGFIAACGAVVQAESLVVRVRAGSALSRRVRMHGNGEEQVEEYTAVRQEEGRDAEMMEAVVLYVGPGLEVSS